MKNLLLLVGIFCLIGCESMPRGESAYQTVHALDTLQTLNGNSKDPCYDESHPVTRRMIGRTPSRDSVILWGVATALAHWGVSSLMEDHTPDWALTTWQVVTAGRTAGTVIDNYNIGIRFYGDNDHTKSNNWCTP